MKHREVPWPGEIVGASARRRAALWRRAGRRGFAAAVVLGALVLSACSGGASGSEDGVASIDGGGNDDQGELEGSAPSGEEELLAYVECLREQGLDIPDPQVDADGNLILDPEALIPGEEGEAPSQAEIDAFAEEMQAAQEVCGSPPEGAVGGFDHGGDQADFQDALVVFARCMRAEGFDVADPDFSSPDWQARFFSEFHSLEGEPAFETCQQEAFGPLGGGG